MRTITLTERVATVYRLSQAELDFLLAEHRTHVQVNPTEQRGHYRLRPAGHIGTIIGPGLRVVIQPKIPVENLGHLLDPWGVLPAAEDQADAIPGSEALNFLAGRLARLLAERSAAGLHRAYAERATVGAFLQGRLDISAQLRDPASRKDLLHCRFDDFTMDVPCNQVPKATAELVLQSPFLGDPVRAALRRELSAFAEVSVAPLLPETFTAAGPDPLTEAYRPLLELCRLLADGLTCGGAPGLVPSPAFLLDMDRVFERYCISGILSAFTLRSEAIENASRNCLRVSVQPWFRADQPVSGQPDFCMRPDLTIDREGRPVVIVDAKWKRLPSSRLLTADVYQVLAYCAALGARWAVLIYPGLRDRVWNYRLARSPVSVTIRKLRIAGPRTACAGSLERLARRLRREAEVRPAVRYSEEDTSC